MHTLRGAGASVVSVRPSIWTTPRGHNRNASGSEDVRDRPAKCPSRLGPSLRFCGGHGRRVEVAEARAVKRPPEFGALSGKHRQPARGWGDTVVVVVGRHRALVELCRRRRSTKLQEQVIVMHGHEVV